MTIKNRLVYCFIFYFSLIFFGMGTGVLFSQNPESKRATHWYFGNGAGLDFSSGSPIAVTNGMLHTAEGCSTISDINGNLLFYTDGDTVWNKNHIPMSNGTGLMGCPSLGSSAQGALIIPQPKNDSLFYVFTVDCAENGGALGLRYTTVNLNLNLGLGDVVLKNIMLYSPTTEGLTAVYNCDMSKIWLMTHEYNTNNYVAYSIDEQGLNLNPVVSSIGNKYTSFQSYMRFSPNGKFFASSYSVSSEMFQFNANTGQLFNHINLPSLSGDYGTCFSNDNTKLYFSNSGSYIYQYDLSDLSNVASSQILVSYNPDNSTYGALSNAIDQKIYIASLSSDSISVIKYPNINGASCSVNDRSIYLSGRLSTLGITDFIQSYFNRSNDENCTDSISIPNVFTPNNDGINDFFVINIFNYSEISYGIYNRWGKEIFKSSYQPITNSTITLWNGKTNGENTSDGVYYYIINLKKVGGEIKTAKGFIHLFH